MGVLGKRKARSGPTISEEDAAAIFRRHFEDQFLPLPGADQKPTKARATDDESASEDEDDESADSEDEDQETEWDGLSESEEEEIIEDVPTIELVDHSGAQPPTATPMSKKEFKEFMSSRPPDQTRAAAKATAPASNSKSSKSKDVPEDAPSLLAQDLELRRLLAESHLLAPARTANGNPAEAKSFAAGRTRVKATDLRVQALGSKTSIHKQEKMPMHMRKGIAAAAVSRETKRRREAKENGIILERETGKKKRRERSREVGVDRPGVGRLKGAQLRLSERDVRSIEGSRDVFGRRGKR